MGNYENIEVLFGQTEEEEGTYYPFNYNPIHAVWQCLLRVGLPESWLNESSFLSAAETVFNEDTGVSVHIRQYSSALVYIKSLLDHVRGILYYGVDGKLHVKLVRDDYTVSNLPIVTPDDLLDDATVERASWMETVSEIKIQFNKTVKVEEAYEVIPYTTTTSTT